jgi:hypothetical protein
MTKQTEWLRLARKLVNSFDCMQYTCVNDKHNMKDIAFNIYFMAQQTLVGLGPLIIEASWSYSDTPHTVGLLWSSDQPDAEASTRQHTAHYRWELNPQFQKASGRRPTPSTEQSPESALAFSRSEHKWFLKFVTRVLVNTNILLCVHIHR